MLNNNNIFNNLHTNKLLLYFTVTVICTGVIIGIIFIFQHHTILDIVSHDINQNQKILNEILELQQLELQEQQNNMKNNITDLLPK